MRIALARTGRSRQLAASPIDSTIVSMVAVATLANQGMMSRGLSSGRIGVSTMPSATMNSQITANNRVEAASRIRSMGTFSHVGSNVFESAFT